MPLCFLFILIFLTATVFPVVLFLAAATIPKAPSPSLLMNSRRLPSYPLSYLGELMSPSCCKTSVGSGCINNMSFSSVRQDSHSLYGETVDVDRAILRWFQLEERRPIEKLFDRKMLQSLMSKSKNPIHRETGSAWLDRHHFFNQRQDDIDVPDGDIEFGKKRYNQQCAGCHNYIGYGPSLISIYGAKGGRQKQFTKYSNKTKAMKNWGWSKQRLFKMLQCPEDMFGVESAMLFDGMQDPYARASIIEYMHFMRLTNHQAVKPKFYVYN